ncbi:YoaK family protein [Brevundimonas sp.]|uniref:YoaK family protein n=1 Tax=Brevundimonas sp. TaxID=1871086 RepID=UPI0037832F42
MLAACFSAVAGYVDVVGFLMTGGYFVSFMSGNSTRLGIGLAGGGSSAGVAAGLILAFVLGVVIGASVGRMAGAHKQPAILGLVTALLCLAVLMHGLSLGLPAVIPLALAMGAQNTVFAENGEVRVGLTYMTGTLVKLGKRVTASLWGGDPFGWFPYLLLWAGLLGGAVVGALTFARFGPNALIAAIAVMLVLTLISATSHRVKPG